jgi:esterase/lipase
MVFSVEFSHYINFAERKSTKLKTKKKYNRSFSNIGDIILIFIILSQKSQTVLADSASFFFKMSNVDSKKVIFFTGIK